jgi:glycyl-tRNA synthetase
MKFSGKDLAVYDETTKTSFVPHVVECSVGVDRLFLTLLCDGYTEDKAEDEMRITLRLHPTIAPIKAAFFPLTKAQNEPMENIYRALKNKYAIYFDSTGSIGKRYRRQDEIGTPVCFTYDFESVQDGMVTVRDRDSMSQKRIAIDAIKNYLDDLLQEKK